MKKGNYRSPFLTIGKTWLLSRLQALLQQGRIRLPDGQAWVEDVVRELLDYEVRQSQSGATITGAFGSAHDDRVTALGLAVVEDFTRRRVRRGPSVFR